MNLSLLAAGPAQGSGMIMVIYIVLIIAFFYFFMMRPQKKEQKRVATMLASSLEIGDIVCTTSGFYGVIIDITDDTVIVEFGNNKNCRIPMQKSAIAQVEKAES